MPTEPQSQPSFTPGRRWKIGFDVLARTLLVVAVVGMLNYLGTRPFLFHRFFLSSQTRIQLSSRTLEILKSLTNHVEVTLYYDKQDNFYPAIVSLLNEYRAADPRITVNTVDYVRDAGEAQKIKEQYKLNSATDKNLVIFDAGGSHVKVANGDGLTQVRLDPIFDPKDPNAHEYRRKPIAFMGEEMFTSMLLAVTSDQPFKAYFLQGHHEPSLSDTGEAGYLKFGSLLAQNYIAVTNLELFGDNPVPMDCNLLIIAGPWGEFSETELQKIDLYLAQGGRLFVLLNLNSVKRPTGLERILARWGVSVGSDWVRDPQTVSGEDAVVSTFSQHPVVNPLAGSELFLMYPLPIGGVKWESPPTGAPKVEELAFASPASTLAGAPADPPHAYPLMAAVEQKPVAGVVNNTPRGTTRMLVVGDSFAFGNQSIKSVDNSDFIGYAVNWLLDRTALLQGIGPRPVTEFKLIMTQTQQREVRWLLLAALPGAVLLFGCLVWLTRRK